MSSVLEILMKAADITAIDFPQEALTIGGHVLRPGEACFEETGNVEVHEMRRAHCVASDPAGEEHADESGR